MSELISDCIDSASLTSTVQFNRSNLVTGTVQQKQSCDWDCLCALRGIHDKSYATKGYWLAQGRCKRGAFRSALTMTLTRTLGWRRPDGPLRPLRPFHALQ
uniref:Uncharacterized protein n=1 Tax=Bionectria ochroleuca TaxID=29856 RepID=A0A8H7K2T1_BIOOC